MGRVLRCLARRGPRRTINPLFIHGPSGAGKSRLVADLVAELTRRVPDAIVAILAAGDLDGRDEVGDFRPADLVVVENAHKARGVEAFAGLVDHCVSRQRQLVVTATAGPGQLSLPGRLTSRLAQGLVVALEALSPGSRRVFLQARAGLADDVLDFLVQHTPGSIRQLEGAPGARGGAGPLAVARPGHGRVSRGRRGPPTDTRPHRPPRRPVLPRRSRRPALAAAVSRGAAAAPGRYVPGPPADADSR